MKIVFLDEATVGKMPAMKKIASLGEYIAYDFSTAEQVLERINDADVVITNKILITRDMMKANPKLKLICLSATGMNNVDLPAAMELGVAVKNVAGYSTNSVAQLTFALLFEHICHVNHFDSFVKSGAYSASKSFTSINPSYSELAGKTFGIVGLGAIGSKVATIAEAFGAEVVYYSTSGANNNSHFKRVEFEELLSSCDIISIHAPLNEATKNLFGEEQLSAMKSTVIIVNVGRGGIVNESALAKAIDNNIIGGACLDVFVEEPMPKNSPLMQVKNKHKIVYTPHIAWASEEARVRLMEMLYQNIIDWQGEGNN
ncbi:MAG: D-2-hydroxyacid dehydrogenase [Bacteroidetes bacterium]|nr:D-2-hydroxyacid dehydrogenase [Bacteroidota bacterium]